MDQPYFPFFEQFFKRLDIRYYSGKLRKNHNMNQIHAIKSISSWE